MRTYDLVFAYFSPETLLPATSIVATIAGIFMILGRGSLRLLNQRGFHRSGRVAGTSKPHVHLYHDIRSPSAGR